MHLPTLTVFTNFRINDEERFLRLKDSFLSFKDIKADKWVINVRGKYNSEVLAFLRGYLGDKLSGHNIETGKGWFHDSRTLLSNIESDYVLYWVEDHVNMVPLENYDSIMEEMRVSQSQFLFTSWWLFDQKQNAYEGIPRESYPNIDTLNIDAAAAAKITEKYKLHFIISALGIFEINLFRRLINTNHPRLRRWPKETPFDLEKRITDSIWLPIKISLPKYELFAPIDDDIHGYIGSSLQSRGLYPKRMTRESAQPKSPSNLSKAYEKLPVPLKWLVDNLITKPYNAIKFFLVRLSYHF